MKEIALNAGEKMMFKLEGDVYGAGANPITQAIAKIQRQILKVLGTTEKATLVVTNQRVIIYSEKKICYVIPADRQLEVLMPSSIRAVGYSRATQCGFFPYFAFFYDSITERRLFPIQGGSDDQLNGYVQQFYNALTASAQPAL